MNRNSIYAFIAFSIIWIILTESFALWSVVTGLVVSLICVYFYNRLLDMEKISNVSFAKLGIYIFYLIGQIYLAGFGAIMLIIAGAKVNIVVINTGIEDDFLRVLLANSITLTPGTITLELQEDRITVLWLRDRNQGFEDNEDEDETIKGGLERMLIKAQKMR